MKKFTKTILPLIFLFLVGFPVLALAEGKIETNPSEGPLFNIENFFPGKKISKEIEIKNNYEEEKKIALRVDNLSPSEGFPSFLQFSVLSEGEKIDCGTIKDLSKIGNQCQFADIPKKEEKKFDFEITFLYGSGNKYMNEFLEFDIIIGFFEDSPDDPVTEITLGGIRPPTPLNIYNERETEVGEDNVTIAWETTRPAFTRIIYDTEPGKFDLDAGSPSYGYLFYTPMTEERSASHNITLTDLTPGNTYYYRIVAYGSFAVSREYEFSLLKEISPDPEEPDPDPVTEPEPIPDVEIFEEVTVVPIIDLEPEPEIDTDPEIEPDPELFPEQIDEPDLEQEEEGVGLLAATIGAFGEADISLYLLIFLILLILVLLIHFSSKIKKVFILLFRKRK